MDWILIGIYSFITLIFLPLFIGLMVKMKKYFPRLYQSIRIKFFSLFAIFMTFLFTRLYLYLDLKNLKLLYSEKSMYTVIPFYVTEIIMAFFLCYILFYVTTNKRSTHSINTSNLSHIIMSND